MPQDPTPNASEPHGFAAMDPDEQRAIASSGGKACHARGTAHEFTREEASRAGRKGGQVVAQDRQHMSEIGRRGGVAVARDREHMARIGKKGGAAVAKDKDHMARIGRMGGEARRTKSEDEA